MFPGRSGTGHIKDNAKMIQGLVVNNFSTDKAAQTSPKKENFAQCMKRLGLSEADVEKRIKNSSQLILICSLLSLPMFIYTLYILISGHFLSSFVCLMLTFLLLAYSFREHFNRFQMQQRRLRCTFEEWLKHLLNSKNSKNQPKAPSQSPARKHL